MADQTLQNMQQDMLGQALYGGMGIMPTTGVGGRAPEGDSQPTNPYLISQQPQLPQTNQFSRLFPNHPGIGQALENASLMMSMIPGGKTIGENISQVAGAQQNLPYAQLAHQYQMLNPQQQYAAQEANIGKTQAESQEALMRGEYLSGRNLAQVQAAEQRDLKQREIQEEMRAPATKVLPATADDPNGHYKKGDPIVGYMVPNLDEKTGAVTRSFQPMGMTYGDYVRGGGISQVGAVSHGSQGAGSAMDQHISNYMNLYKQGKSGKVTDQDALWREAEGDYDRMMVNRGVAMATGKGNIGEGQSDVDKISAKNRADLDNGVLNKEINEQQKMQGMKYDAFVSTYGDKLDPSEFVPKIKDAAGVATSRLQRLKSTYNKAYPKGDYDGGFAQFAQENGYDAGKHLFDDQVKTIFGSSGPTSGVANAPARPSGVPANANWNPATRTWSTQ